MHWCGHVQLQERHRVPFSEGRHEVDAAEAADVVAEQAAPSGEELDAALGQLPPRIQQDWIL